MGARSRGDEWAQPQPAPPPATRRGPAQTTMGSVDTSRASAAPPPAPAPTPHQLVPSRGCAPPARLSAAAGASPPQLPNPYERAMAAASGAAAAAAAAASAASAIFGPCGDVGVAFPQCPHLPVPPPVPPVPPVPPLLHLPRPRFPRPRAPAPASASSPASGPAQDMSDGDSVVRGAYSVQVRVFPDGRVERISRSFEAESGRLAGRAPPRPRPPSPAPPQHHPTPALPAPPGVESAAAAAGDAPEERCVISNKSFQALPSLSEESAWEESDERSSIITVDDDTASTVTATKVGPCWTSCPAEADEEAVRDGDASGRFPDMELLKDMLRGMFQSFRRDPKEPTEQYVSPEEGTATHRATDVGFTTEFDPKFIRPNIEEEGMIEMDDEAVQTQDVEMRESTTDMVTVTDEEGEAEEEAADEEEMAEDEEEAKMDVEVEAEPVAEAEPVQHRSWSPPPLAPPPRTQPLPPPVQPSPTPPTAQARVAAFAASAAPPLPPGAVFFESGTYVADGADPEYVERMMTMRETAMRAAERAVSNACGCFSSFFGNYSCAGERRP